MGHADQADPCAYAAAGATWWLENVHDLRGSFDEMLALVRRGTARLAGEHAEHPAEERMPPASPARTRALFRASGGRPGSPRAGW